MRVLPTLLLLLVTAAPSAVIAQTAEPVTLRVGKLEKEMRAVQRVVFPKGAPVEPEIGGSTSILPEGSPATTAVADLTARVDAIESQLKSVTGQVEQQGFRLKKLEDAMKANEARMKVAEAETGPLDTPDAVAPAAVTPRPVAAAPAPKPAVAAPKPAVVTPKPAAPAATVKAAATTDPKRKALVDAVPIPVTNDPVEDSYTYGFRLWSAKLYPEARQHLRDFVAKNPKHRRNSYARNLMGRAYFEDRLYNAAAKAFLENYQGDPKGERAAESLSWLGLSLQRLSPPQLANACKVYKEFDDVYGDSANADVKARVTKGRTDAKCPA